MDNNSGRKPKQRKNLFKSRKIIGVEPGMSPAIHKKEIENLQLTLQRAYADRNNDLLEKEIETENVKNKFRTEVNENQKLREKLAKTQSELEEINLNFRETRNKLEIRGDEAIGLQKTVVDLEQSLQESKVNLLKSKGQIDSLSHENERLRDRLRACEVLF